MMKCAKGYTLRFQVPEAPEQLTIVGGMRSAFGKSAALVGIKATEDPMTVFVQPITKGRKGDQVGGGRFDQIDMRPGQWAIVDVKIYEDDKGVWEMLAHFISTGPAAFWAKAWTVRYEIRREGDQVAQAWEHAFDKPWHGLYREVKSKYLTELKLLK